MNRNRRTLVYGPVPSRRLGMSLGVDPIPRLTCTFDCVYCQLGRKRHKVSGPEEVKDPFPAPDEIAEAVKEALKKRRDVDVVSFSGSGEPTLNPKLGKAVEEIRKITHLPIVLITNSSLLSRLEVLDAAAQFDLVLPSLDAGDQTTFLRINRPAPGFRIDVIAESIERLARRVPIWLEVMLVASETHGTNVDDDAISHVIEKVRRIRPTKVTLNTCVRPPAEPVQALSEGEMRGIKDRMAGALRRIPVELIQGRVSAGSKGAGESGIAEEFLSILSVRPCTVEDLAQALGLNPSEIGKHIRQLMGEGKVKRCERAHQIYYSAAKEDVDGAHHDPI
jgi:wyosine [tRNA(Phe)-imidazoG37] synthetase (radical SAM superfamily)